MGHGGPMPYVVTELEGGLKVGADTRHSCTGQVFLFLEEIESGNLGRRQEEQSLQQSERPWMVDEVSDRSLESLHWSHQ